METVKEKLVRILDDYWEVTMTVEDVADVLISNGVTIDTDTNVGDKWVSVAERLPEEADSIFAKFYGTEKWDNAMFRKYSDNVIVCIEYEDGTRRSGVARTLDGKWNLKGVWKMKVTHWMPLPQPPKEVQ